MDVCEGVYLPFVGGVNTAGDEIIGGESCTDDGVFGGGVMADGGGDGDGLEEFGLPVVRGGAMFRLSSAGTGMLRACARAIVMSDAVWNRASGSLAMLFRMTSESAGGMFGLIRAGGVGSS